ncbi:MAG: hypothetical protein KJ941_10245 [Bacteroidetes bacterium]|nr:hypothetical protein [Bacteroidota bacterium]
MKQIVIFLVLILFYSCRNERISTENSNTPIVWNEANLKKKATDHLDSTKWDKTMFKEDIENYNQYAKIFNSYPINKTPFPVALYDYAVSSVPFTIEKGKRVFKGVKIGEYVNPKSDEINFKMTLIVSTGDRNAGENSLVESRNYPYLVAQGYFLVRNDEIDWVFTSSPDGQSTLLVNMKLFDLRFGETVVIYPQSNHSFLYQQIDDSPNNYESLKDFKEAISKRL